MLGGNYPEHKLVKFLRRSKVTYAIHPDGRAYVNFFFKYKRPNDVRIHSTVRTYLLSESSISRLLRTLNAPIYAEWRLWAYRDE